MKSLEDPAEVSNVSEAPGAIRRWLRWLQRTKEIGATSPDPTILVKGLSKIARKVLEAHKDLQFRVSLARNALGIDVAPTEQSVSQYAAHLLAEIEQVALTDKRTAKGDAAARQKDPPWAKEKAKASKLKKAEAEGEREGQETGSEEKGKCKFYLSDGGCRRGKTCSWSHDQKDEKRRCFNCGSPEHLSPACQRPKGSSSSPPTRPKIQKAEGEEQDKGKGKTEEAEDGEGGSMKGLISQANKMLKSLTENSSSTSSTTSEPNEERDRMVTKLQEQLNALKLKTFQLSRMCSSSVCGLIDSGATHALRSQRPGENCKRYKHVRVTFGQWTKNQTQDDSWWHHGHRPGGH